MDQPLLQNPAFIAAAGVLLFVAGFMLGMRWKDMPASDRRSAVLILIGGAIGLAVVVALVCVYANSLFGIDGDSIL